MEAKREGLVVGPMLVVMSACLLAVISYFFFWFDFCLLFIVN